MVPTIWLKQIFSHPCIVVYTFWQQCESLKNLKAPKTHSMIYNQQYSYFTLVSRVDFVH